MAAITDKFNKAANGTGVYPSIAAVTTAREGGGSVLTCDDLAGWSTDTAVHFSTYRLMSDGSVDTSTQSDWKGVVSGNTITQMTWLAGSNDSGHLIGDKVELNPTVGWLDDLVTGILKSHAQDGSLRDNIIQNKNITSKAVKSGNIDWSTFGSKYTKNTTSTGTVANGSYKTAASLTLDQPGTYILFANSRAEFLGGTYQNFYMRITDGSGNVLSPQTGFYGGQQGGVLGQFTISTIGEVTITSPTTINSQVTATGSSGGFANHNSLAAIRVA